MSPSSADHILLVPSWYPSPAMPGRGAFFRDQAFALRDAGYRVGVIAPEVAGLKKRRRSNLPGPQIMREDDLGIATYRKVGMPIGPNFARRNAMFWLRTGRQLFDAYVREQGVPRLIHAHAAILGGVLAEKLSRRDAIPYVLTEHNSSYAEATVSDWQRKWARQAYAGARARLVVSRALGTVLSAQFRDACCPWQVVPNTLNALYEKPIDDKPSRQPGRYSVLSVAALGPLKAQDILIAAFAGRLRGCPGARLRLVGGGDMDGVLRPQAVAFGVGDQVEFLGALEPSDIRREMLAADVVAISSYHETFGVVAIEALACGTPVVATACGGPEDTVDDTNGILVPPGNAPAMAEALDAMRLSRDRYDAQALRGPCLARYGRAAVAAQLGAVYDEIFGRCPTKQACRAA